MVLFPVHFLNFHQPVRLLRAHERRIYARRECADSSRYIFVIIGMPKAHGNPLK